MKRLTKLSFLAIYLFFASCVATVPSIPTTHIPDKAHEVDVSGAFGIPRYSLNVAYNPHRNFGLVAAGNLGRESLGDFLIIPAAASGEISRGDKWRRYVEGGVAVYHHFSDELSMSITPTFGSGNFTAINTFVKKDTFVGRESRAALFLNGQYKTWFSDEFNLALRIGVKVAANTLKFDNTSIDAKELVGKSVKFTSLEPMVYFSLGFRHLSFFSISGLDVLAKEFGNPKIEGLRLPFYGAVGMSYTFNGAKPWVNTDKKKR